MSTTTLPPAAPAVPIQDHTYAGYRFLYCHACHFVVFQAGLPEHLRKIHRTLPRSQRRQILDQFAALSDVVSRSEHATHPLPPDHSPPIPYLPTYEGFTCGQDDCCFLSQSYDCLMKHLNSRHALYRGACAPFVHRVTLQSWYGDRRAKYWIVSSEGKAAEEGRETEGHKKRGKGHSDRLCALAALQTQEQERLDRRRQDYRAGGTALQATESTLWLRHTQWPVQFANRPLDILAATTVLPHRLCTADYILGAWEGTDFMSPVEDELRLCRLLKLLSHVFDRCLQTLKATPEPLRCWLKSYAETTFCSKPFAVLERQASQRRYLGYWRRFLCFVFRAWRTELPLRNQIYGIQFSAVQEALMTQIWTLLDKLEADKGLDDNDDLGRGPTEGIAESDNDSDLEYNLDDDLDDDGSDDDSDDSSDDSPNNNLGNGFAKGRAESDYDLDLELEHSGPDDDYLGEGSAEELVEPGRDSDLGSDRGLELAEQLFQLSCAFWTDLSRTGKTLHLPLVYFAGVLSIQQEGLAYRTAYLYTTLAASLVWVGRLLMLEYALPQQAYHTLGRPSCAACPDQLRRLQRIRRKYLCRGGPHAMAHILELLYKGRTIAKREGRRANLSWSPDRQVLHMDNVGAFSMAQFRTMVWVTIQDCQKLLQELMFGWQPAVNLDAIQDNLTNIQAGWSFLEEPANKLRGSFRHLHQRA